jgi:hypothetical protein
MEEHANWLLGWSPEVWTAIGTLVLAAVTVAALFLQDPIRRRYGLAELSMSIASRLPDVHFIMMTGVTTEGGLHQEPVLYIRVLVTHRRGRTAENVELFAARVWEIDTSARTEVGKFLPMQLLWSNADGATSLRIPPGVSRHCDLGYIGRGYKYPRLVVSTKVQPAGVGTFGELPSVLDPGTYEIEVVLSGDNVKPISKAWRITCPATWSNNESTMIAAAAVTPV